MTLRRLPEKKIEKKASLKRSFTFCSNHSTHEFDFQKTFKFYWSWCQNTETIQCEACYLNEEKSGVYKKDTKTYQKVMRMIRSCTHGTRKRYERGEQCELCSYIIYNSIIFSIMDGTAIF
jgi:hypothetical protein